MISVFQFLCDQIISDDLKTPPVRSSPVTITTQTSVNALYAILSFTGSKGLLFSMSSFLLLFLPAGNLPIIRDSLLAALVDLYSKLISHNMFSQTDDLPKLTLLCLDRIIYLSYKRNETQLKELSKLFKNFGYSSKGFTHDVFKFVFNRIVEAFSSRTTSYAYS